MPKDASWYERQFQKSYVGYTRKQEEATPQFQRLIKLLKQKYGSTDNMPADIREELHRHSLSLMKWNGLLTFNFRETWFFLFCLLDEWDCSRGISTTDTSRSADKLLINFKLQLMKWTKQRLNNLFFFLGIAAVVVMLFTFDVSFIELWDHLCHAGYWLIPIIGIWVVVYWLNALAWQSMIEGNIGGKAPVSFWRIYRLTITGYALNYATPVGGLGGEPYRIMELSKDIDNQHATSSVILYAMMHFFAHFWFWFISIFIYLGLVLIGDLPISVAIGVILGIIVVFCLVAFYIISRGYKNGLVKYVLGVLSRIPGMKRWTLKFWARHSEAIKNIDEQIAALYAQDTKAFYKSLVLEYLSRVVQSMEVMFMLLLFGIDCGGGLGGLTLTFLHSILIVSFTTLFANLIGFLPMQLGVQEGGFVLSIAALGLSAALGIFVSIICRVREIIWIVIGIGLMKMKK